MRDPLPSLAADRLRHSFECNLGMLHGKCRLNPFLSADPMVKLHGTKRLTVFRVSDPLRRWSGQFARQALCFVRRQTLRKGSERGFQGVGRSLALLKCAKLEHMRDHRLVLMMRIHLVDEYETRRSFAHAELLQHLRHCGMCCAVLEYVDGTGFIEPDVGIELARQHSLKIVALQLCLRPVDHADRPLQTG